MNNKTTIRFALPKGRMFDSVTALLNDAGIRIAQSSRDYRPTTALENFDTKILKPRAIVEMLATGQRDLGFAGADWVAEDNADLVELLDTRLDPVRLVAAAPESILTAGRLPNRPIILASEYTNIAARWIASQNLDATLIRSYGATEVLPPEDADCIIDNTASGSTLAANALVIIDQLMTSSTRIYASRAAINSPEKRPRIESFVMLVASVLEARTRVMLELNVSSENLARVIEILPCMREPTVSPMHAGAGYAVKSAVLRNQLPTVIPAIKARGGTDIVVTTPQQIVL
ncbi:MAG: ATP phosphoribosyltransferase [Phycisphaeraceae bacterium]|nr:ATP phosphoribosyltransferase [Phycisphaeraceae bacterium]MCW5763969.1 ATP phosphoribosyltransferase [Phycisphaeraceae bacterium]